MGDLYFEGNPLFLQCSETLKVATLTLSIRHLNKMPRLRELAVQVGERGLEGANDGYPWEYLLETSELEKNEALLQGQPLAGLESSRSGAIRM